MKHWLPLGLTAVVACSAPAEEPAPASQPRALRIDGSTTLYQAMGRVAAQFEAQHGDIDALMARSSSSRGIARLIDGAIDVATSSRPPTADELQRAQKLRIVLKPYQVGYDAIAVIVHPDRYASAPALSLGQLRGIFLDGSLRDWSQLAPAVVAPAAIPAVAPPAARTTATGSTVSIPLAAIPRAPQPAAAEPAQAELIDVYVRSPAESGTALTFIGRIAGSGQTPFLDGAQVLDSTEAVVAAVAANPRGIGFAPLGFVDERVRAVALGLDDRRFIAPSAVSIRDLSYPLRRNLYLVTRGTPRGHLNLFLRFVLGSQGRDILAASGVLRML
jgi:phosphate transport system substrate-binding protein